eukprot:Clim_evm4s141 gene=Clim_evmTU4s141
MELEQWTDPDWERAVLFFRGPLIGVTFLALWGVDEWVMEKRNIAYEHMFGMTKRDYASPTEIFSAAGYMGLLVSICMILYYTTATHSPIYPMFLYIALFTALMFPGQRFLGGTRKFITRILGLCIIPGRTISFVEVVIADGLTSMSKVFADLSVTTCVLGHELVDQTRGVPAQCGHSFLVPLATSIPYLIRGLQCWISYQDTGLAFPHIANLVKYMTALPVIFLPYITRELLTTADGSSADADWKSTWLVFAFVNSMYSFWWDVKMDWGLGDSNQSGLRAVLLYPLRECYYLLIAGDFLLRFLWSFNLPFALGLTPSNALLMFEFLEVFRRGIWNLYRIEWEQIKRGLEHVPNSPKEFPLASSTSLPH